MGSPARDRSLLARARPSGGALLVGCGGGGDIVQCLPVMNYLRRLGVERFALANIAVKWWGSAGRIAVGAEALDVSDYQPGRRVHEEAVECTAETRLVRGPGKGLALHESEVARITGLPVFALGMHGGAEGLLGACRTIMAEHDLDLFVTVDIGADAFFTGTETTVVSPLADSMSLHAATVLDGVYGLAGYACDAEIPIAHLNATVAQVMRRGGFLGAHGLTPADVELLTGALDRFPEDEIERWPLEAAAGRLGTQYCKRFWTVEVTPLAAVTLFFDPGVIAELNPLPGLLAATQSLAEAEELVLERTCLIPETRLPPWIEVPHSGRSPDRPS